jgi:ABC-type multidrug transport system fused ATPase/permease subunit
MLVISLTIYDWHSVFFLMLILLPAIVFYRIIKQRLNTIDHSLRTNYPGLIHHLLRLFENFIEINLYQKKEYFVKKVQQLNHQLQQSQVLQTVLQANSFRLFETTAAVGLCILILYSVVAQTSPEVTVVLLGLYTAAGFRAVPSFNRIFIAFLQIRTNEHVLTGLTKFKVQKEESGSPHPVHFNTTLELKNASFHFPDKPLILHPLNLTIIKGQRIALTGPSGSGKTTLLLLLMRFLKETQGEIRVDGIVLEDHHCISWRKHLAYVPQHPIILDGSLIENVAFGIDPEKADREKITELLHILDLATWLNQLPDGLMTRFGERGIKLSGGQRQRLAIARALYSGADLLLFDEATSQVDSVTEKVIHEALKTVAHQNKTLIMVTHRPTSLHFFDRVFRLQQGEILELKQEGSHV